MRWMMCIIVMLGPIPTAHAYLDPCQALGVGCGSSSEQAFSSQGMPDAANGLTTGGSSRPSITLSSVPTVQDAPALDPGAQVIAPLSSSSAEALHLGAPNEPKKPLAPTGPPGIAILLIGLAACATLFPLFHHEKHDA